MGITTSKPKQFEQEYKQIIKQKNTSNPVIEQKNKRMFQFTRHLPSCNNLNEGKLFGKDFEPSASIFGIKNTLMYAFENQQQRFKANKVCVSNLLRTWITATLLYGSIFENTGSNFENTGSNTELSLYVYPFLKEKVKNMYLFSVKRGNFPKSIDATISKFNFFLNTYLKLKKDFPKFLDDLESSNQYPDLPNLSSRIKLYIPDRSDSDFINKFTFTLNASKYEYEMSVEQTGGGFFFKSNINASIQCKRQEIYDTIGPNTSLPGYTTDGDLEKFMKYYNEKNKTNNDEVVHVVTHSATMKAYLKNKNKPSLYNEAIKTNLWSFKTHQNNNDIVDLMEGVELNELNASMLEMTYRDVSLSLCGVQNDKKNVCLEGGRRTFKRKKKLKSRRIL